jgi:hypothetical protein
VSIVESESGGVTHYRLIRDSSAPDLVSPTAEFRNFVRGLGEGQISTAVSLGQFQRAVERTLKGVADASTRPDLTDPASVLGPESRDSEAATEAVGCNLC